MTLPVCIVVPVYRTDLSPAERVSLERCLSILGTHPIILATPDTIDITPLQDRHRERQGLQPTHAGG
jgi:hypothetical protein